MSITYRLRIIPFLLIFCFALSIDAFAKDSKQPFVIVIDAGHGGKDVGAVDNGVKEKDINLGVALQLGDLLKKKMKDVKVVYTREDDTYLTLQQRADKANASKGTLFISIHTNSLDHNNPKRTSVEGASVYVLGLHKDDNNMKVAQRENAVIKLEDNFEEKYEGFNPQRDESYIIFEMAQKKNLSNSIKFANEAEKQLQSVAGRKGRGVHQAGFWVLWATAMPGVLVEVDFICNPGSAEFISSQAGQKKLAEALFKSIQNYRKELKLAEKQPKKTTSIVDTDCAVTLAESTKSTRVKTDAPRLRASKTGSTKRRRRSSSARRVSEEWNYETEYIAINTHSDKKLIGGLVVENETPVLAKALDIEDDSQTDKQKKNRKDRKVRARKEQKADSRVRIVNGHEVVVSNGENASTRKITAKENSEQAKKGSRARNNPDKAITKVKSGKDSSVQQQGAVQVQRQEPATQSASRGRSLATNATSKQVKAQNTDKGLMSESSAERRVKAAFSSKDNMRKNAEADSDSRLNRRSRNHR